MVKEDPDGVARHAYCDETDYWRIRQFLRHAFLLNGRREWCWSLLRWDYWRWHIHENLHHFPLSEVVYVWEDGKQIVAVLNPDNPGEAFLQLHPAHDAASRQCEMLDRAEERLASVDVHGKRRLTVWVHAHDKTRQALVRERGYQKTAVAETLRRRRLDQPVPSVPLAQGYHLRALGDEAELPARSWVSWKAFHPDEPDERYQGWEWYRNVQRGPLYRRDLDLVVAAPGGERVAFCTVWFDDVTRTAVFEPVGTHPDHQQRGLGKAAMTEGLRRARHLGATLASVSSYGPAAHALYHALGFTDCEWSEAWAREW